MSAASRKTGRGREPRSGTPEPNTDNRQTPNADMQDEDAGTAASGNDERASGNRGAMKQTSKTEHEAGSKR